MPTEKSFLELAYNPDWISDEIPKFFVRYYTHPFIDPQQISLPINPEEEINFLGILVNPHFRVHRLSESAARLVA